jgi:hypothetical protein
MPSEILLSIPALVELNNNSMRFQVEMSVALAHEANAWNTVSTSHSALAGSCDTYAATVQRNADSDSRLSLAQHMSAFSKFHARFSSGAHELVHLVWMWFCVCLLSCAFALRSAMEVA